MLSPNKTLSIECCSGTSINSVSCVIVISPIYSIADVLYIIIFYVILYNFIQCCMCVCHMFIKVLTYLLRVRNGVVGSRVELPPYFRTLCKTASDLLNARIRSTGRGGNCQSTRRRRRMRDVSNTGVVRSQCNFDHHKFFVHEHRVGEISRFLMSCCCFSVIDRGNACCL